MEGQTPSPTVEAALRGRTEGRAAQLLNLKENQWFEKKSSRTKPRDLAKLMIAMANADGGTIVVGLHDGKIDGVESIGPRLNEFQQASGLLRTESA